MNAITHILAALVTGMVILIAGALWFSQI